MARSAISNPASLSHDFSKSSPGLGIASGRDACGPPNILDACDSLDLVLSSCSAVASGPLQVSGYEGTMRHDGPWMVGDAGLPTGWKTLTCRSRGSFLRSHSVQTVSTNILHTYYQLHYVGGKAYPLLLLNRRMIGVDWRRRSIWGQREWSTPDRHV